MAYTTEQRREYQNQYREKRREQAREFLGGKCIECGSINELEFDHIDPSTKVDSIASYLDAAKAVFWEEVKKCQLLCHDCHVEKSKREGSYRQSVGLDPANKILQPLHGTEVMYRRERCRCDKCKSWKRLARKGLVDSHGKTKSSASSSNWLEQ